MLGLGLLLLCVSLTAGCSVVSDGANAYVAPVGVIPATDVVVQTNLQTALQQLQTFSATQGTLTGYSASGFVSGASTTAGETSFNAPNSQTLAVQTRWGLCRKKGNWRA